MNARHEWIPYCGAAPVPADWLARWNFDPLLLVALAGLGAGWLLLFRHQPPRRQWRFGAAFVLLLLLFVSPLCALSSALFAARVVHHVVLTAVIAPLLLFALPPLRRVAAPLALATAVQALVFWAWHSPALYAAALSSAAVYWAMQLTLLAAGLAFWAGIRAASAPAAVAALLATMVQMGLLGALITFSGTALYAPHFASTAAWGLSPLEDQQLGGLVMWAPSAALYLAAALAIAHRWLRAETAAPAR